MKYLWISIMLCIATLHTTNNGCEHTGCALNPTYNPITVITQPDKNNWCYANQQDTIDKLIFDGKPIPYSFQDIKEIEEGYLYVLNNNYLPILACAQQNFKNKKKAIELKSATIYAHGAAAHVHSNEFEQSVIDQQPFALAKQRLAIYKRVMDNKFSPRTHNCPGCIIHRNTALCVTQWAFSQHD